MVPWNVWYGRLKSTKDRLNLISSTDEKITGNIII